MKKDAHYYAVLAFSRACGFKKESAFQIASASQFVDDAKINHIVLQTDPGSGIEHDIIEGKPSFFNMATCHSYTRMKTFNYSAMIHNTCTFHFPPGCKGELFAKKLRCSEKSPVITGILEEAIEEDNLVRFGMLLHVFADSFSHQGFSGLLSKVNDISECNARSKIPGSWLNGIKKVAKWFFKDKFDKKFDALMPAYGHGQAMDYPDLPFLEWSYEYDYSDEFSASYKPTGILNNKKRFTNAFNEIMKYLNKYLANHPKNKDDTVNFKDFKVLFNTLLTQKNDKGREKKWKKTLIEEGLFKKGDHQLQYNEFTWLNDAFSNFNKEDFNNRIVVRATLKSTFSNSSWYKYYLAVKWYKERFFKHCANHNLNIPR